MRSRGFFVNGTGLFQRPGRKYSLTVQFLWWLNSSANKHRVKAHWLLCRDIFPLNPRQNRCAFYQSAGQNEDMT